MAVYPGNPNADLPGGSTQGTTHQSHPLNAGEGGHNGRAYTAEATPRLNSPLLSLFSGKGGNQKREKT